jgi:hypothetical protein
MSAPARGDDQAGCSSPSKGGGRGEGCIANGTRFQYDPASGEIQAILRVPAGYGKVAVLDELQSGLQISPDRIVYVGDGRSDVHVMFMSIAAMA